MALHRLAYTKLQAWKVKGNRKPLLLRGARQVGKTTLVNAFAAEYDHFISLNLELSRHSGYFAATDDVTTIFSSILLQEGIDPEADETVLLFLDEIQEVPKAIQLLRYFYEELPQVHVIAAGSLLEFAIAEVHSFPVGRLEQMALHPMNFEEFLMAEGNAPLLQAYRDLVYTGYHYTTLMDRYHQYVQVGGMPEVVSYYYKNNRSLVGVAAIFDQIWDSYIDDTLKYGESTTNKEVLRYILSAAPFNLDRLSFSKFGKSQYQSREIGDAFRKLDLARILRIIYPSTNTALPIIPDLNKRPRPQFLDTGLLMHINGLQGLLFQFDDLLDFYKGQIANHAVCQEHMSTQSAVHYKPHFWVREKSDANSEVDLVVRWNQHVIPIEVKAGASGRLRSLHQFIDRAPHAIGVRLLANELSVEQSKTIAGKPYTLLNLPYFAGAKTAEALDRYMPDDQLGL